MEIVICADAERAGIVAAEKVVERVAGKDAPVIGFATGSSPLGLYAHLQSLVEAGELDLSRAHGFALDEYLDIDHDHPESYHSVIRRTVTEPLKLDPARVHVPDGASADHAAAGLAYEAAIRDAGGVDVQILGIGTNGHIGFNEPFSSFGSRTRVVPLTAQTRADNARFFDSPEQVPTHAMTQGLATILDAHSAVLVATGVQKAEAIAKLVEGPVAVVHPASLLQFHRDVVIVIDQEAASLLTDVEHFVRV